LSKKQPSIEDSGQEKDEEEQRIRKELRMKQEDAVRTARRPKWRRCDKLEMKSLCK
jgi:hypothetical protein